MTPEQARLAAALRELRARTGLSLAALAAKTAFSKSSWERYLNGRTLPPRTAVQELCRLAGEPDGRCLALWEMAESQWSGRATQAVRTSSPVASAAADPVPPPDPAETSQGGGHRGAATVAVIASVCAVAVGGVAVALLLLPRQSAEPRPAAAAASTPGPHCRASSCEGRNPMAMFCAATPDTLATRHTATGAWLELRYSKVCGTSWARMWGTRVGDRIELTADGRVRGAEVGNAVDADNFVYTPMTVTGPGTVLRVCFRPAKGRGEECFNSVSR
ncbi:helix-turn-helix domain-containing protein [Streptomyces guryensis]|uniref:XRE family transcriptional regulator n=1 Tax=Streptomyces guryensis TaxID=2886947 RepID=A0A9Q3VRT7_9ACTN|nr:XRE family transcriptional regulator [Streptomyces guryensis]MCD9876036.1 XRE family transcriptional regulator [Streptomyces guryensis]